MKLKFLKYSLALIFLLLSFLIFAFTIQTIYLPDVNLIGEKITSGGIEIYDRTGEILISKSGPKRSWVNFEDIPSLLIKTVLIAEDKNFYKHKGFSFEGIIRSIYLNVKSGELKYGGSTITQQLVRNLFLNKEKTILRKLNEIILAIKIEQKYSKNEILNYYLNSIYYGEGNIGIRAAAEYYFDKNLKDLNLSEMAILASIPRAPLLYSPINSKNLERLKKRRDYILQNLKNEKIITEKDYEQAIKQEIKIVKPRYSGTIAPHFFIETLSILKKMFPNQNLEELNLKVITTLDYELQKIAEKAVVEGAERNKSKYGGANASMMVIDPKTGEILALVGSKNFFDESIDGQVNIPFRLRQPGSAFKPLFYAALFELGYPDETIIFDVPTNFGNYRPKNFDKKFKGPVSLRQALAESRNVPSVKVFYLAIPERVIEITNKCGMNYIKDWKNYGLSMALGTAEVKMADLLRFYAALANDGKMASQSFILKIIKDKKIIYEYKPEYTQIVSQQTARILNDILKDANARSGLLSASLPLTIFDDYEVALKTGTTQFYQDAWTFAYTPTLAVAVWAGNTSGKRMNSLGASLVAALPIFNQFMKESIKQNKVPKEYFIVPEERTIDKPMLNGKWQSEYGIHSILYYVNRNNPLGEIPENPYDDSQFKFWEQGVKNWFNIQD